MTGVRQGPIYRRRVRGAHKGLKRMLVEGMGEGGDPQGSWRGFSGAMVRQAVGEAVGSLPPRQRQLIKLAYFSDLSNREIAQGLGITLSSVERGLRHAIARVSEQAERGRTAGRKAIYALAMFMGGRWLSEAHLAPGMSAQPWVKAGAVLFATATAGAVLASHPASPAKLAHVEQAAAPAVASQPTNQVLQPHIGLVRQDTDTVVEHAKATRRRVHVISVAQPSSTVPAVALTVKVKVEEKEKEKVKVKVKVPRLPA
jgi:DNA-binding CsgD family transcriptional regulator